MQAALYRHSRLRNLKEIRSQISLIMNLNQTAVLQSGDIRNPAGSGPNWFVPATGQVDPFVLDGAGLCDTVAETLLDMRSDVAGVEFPASDKQHMMNALHEEAASWSARGRAWRAAGTPDVEARVAEIAGHIETAVQEAAHVQHYFKPYNEVLG